MKENGYTQRRACALAGIDPRIYRYRSSRRMTQTCEPGCVSWRMSGGGSAIVACTSC